KDEQLSFASGVDALAETGLHDAEPLADRPRDETENTGSFFLVGAPREAARPADEPSPELRTFFEDGAAERPDFQQDAAPASDADSGFSWTYEAEKQAEPTTYHVEPSREPTHEPVYEPEIVDSEPVRLHEEIVDAEVVTPAAGPFRPAKGAEG